MGENSKIEWCEHTFNPWHGCTRVSNGDRGACKFCYAADLAKRYGWGTFGGPGEGVGYRTRTSAANWKKPLAWDRAAAAAGARPFVFCASLADVFDNEVLAAWRRDLFDLIRGTPHLVWLLLTKRPHNIVKLFDEVVRFDPRERPDARVTLWPRNAAIGCTVVSQVEADRDVPILLRAKETLRPAFAFVSMEPLMGPVRLGSWLRSGPHWGESIDWVIAGGESGRQARPSHPEWFRDLRDECLRAGIPFHFKQWGENCPLRPELIPVPRRHIGWVAPNGRAIFEPTDADFARMEREDRRSEDGAWAQVVRVGKKDAGRLLDGVLHDARPRVAA